MIKFYVYFSSKNNWYIYRVNVETRVEDGQTEYFIPQFSSNNDKISYRNYWSLPHDLKYERSINQKFLFDSREDATNATDQLLQDRILDQILEKKKIIAKLEEEISKLMSKESKGKYLNFVLP